MISYKGYDTQVLTMPVSHDGIESGHAAGIDASGNVLTATANGDIMGVCLAVRDNYASVQTEGYVELEYTGTAPVCGLAKLVGAGSGKVKVATAEGAKQEYRRVIKVDSTNHIVGFIL